MVEACKVAKAARAAGLNGAGAHCSGAARTTSRAATTGRCTCTAPRSASTRRARSLAWDHVIVGQSILTGTPFEAFMVKDGIDATMVEGMGEPYDVPMSLTVHHPQGQRAGAVVAQRGLDPHRLRDGDADRRNRAHARKQDPVAYRMKLIGDKHPRHRAALQLAVDKSRLRQEQLAAGPRLGRGGARVVRHRGRLCGRGLGARTARRSCTR